MPAQVSPPSVGRRFDLTQGLAVPRGLGGVRMAARCIHENGVGDTRYRDGGSATAQDFQSALSQCRQGSSVTLDEADVLSQARSRPWIDANRAAIERIHDAAGRNDLEAIAQFFESPAIADASLRGTSSAWRRLDSVLSAFEIEGAPGVRFHWKTERFSDRGFWGTPTVESPGFRDPHRGDSSNQVGHFLTAIGLGFDSSLPEQTVHHVGTMREVLKAPAALSNDDVIVALIVGHELIADTDGSDVSSLSNAQAQFHAGVAHPEYLNFFRDAAKALGDDFEHPNLGAAEVILRRIPIDPRGSGNSYQDLRLSLLGFYLGRLVANGIITEQREISRFMRGVIGGANLRG